MGKEDLANQYAETKIGELKAMIEGAYLKGYEQAVLDLNKSINIDGIEYVDMGLPSGTLWSTTPLTVEEYNLEYIKLCYNEALNYPIPSIDQWDELCEYCHFYECYIIGPSGKKIRYAWGQFDRIYDLGEACEQNRNMFWLKGEIDASNNAPTMIYDLSGKSGSYTPIHDSCSHFIGYHLPIFLVKTKGK